MAGDRCPQLLLPLVGVQSLPPDKKNKTVLPKFPPMSHLSFLDFFYFFHAWVIFHYLFLSLLWFGLHIYCTAFTLHLFVSSPLHPPFFILGLIPCPLLHLIFELDADWGVLATMGCPPSYHLGSVGGFKYMAETGHVVMNHIIFVTFTKKGVVWWKTDTTSAFSTFSVKYMTQDSKILLTFVLHS